MLRKSLLLVVLIAMLLSACGGAASAPQVKYLSSGATIEVGQKFWIDFDWYADDHSKQHSHIEIMVVAEMSMNSNYAIRVSPSWDHTTQRGAHLANWTFVKGTFAIDVVDRNKTGVQNPGVQITFPAGYTVTTAQ